MSDQNRKHPDSSCSRKHPRPGKPSPFRNGKPGRRIPENPVHTTGEMPASPSVSVLSPGQFGEGTAPVLNAPSAAATTSATATVTVTVTDLNNLGCGVGRLDGTGTVIFVKGAVTGDVVEAQIIKRTPSYMVGRLIRIVSPSPIRLPDDPPFCTAPEACGGCVFRHVTYEEEQRSKHERVIRAFRQAGLADVTVRQPLTTGVTRAYRNKGLYPVRAGKYGTEVGFFASRSHKIIPSFDCALQPPLFGQILRFLCCFADEHDIPPYNEETKTGILRHIYLRTSASGQIMVCLVVRTDKPFRNRSLTDELTRRLTEGFPSVVSVQLNIQSEPTNLVLGPRFVTLFGESYLEDTLCGRRFRLSGGSFFQVNHDAAELLFRTAAELAGFTGNENLWDLYCGVGTVGLILSDRVRTVTGVEIVREAVDCACQNARLNEESGCLAPGTARFFCADAGDPDAIFAPADRGDAPAPDAVVIDPPRKGTTPSLIRALSERQVKKIVYISCDPETLGRDCALFRKEGYAVGSVQPVDLFPRTGHIECVVRLEKSDKQVFSPEGI